MNVYLFAFLAIPVIFLQPAFAESFAEYNGFNYNEKILSVNPDGSYTIRHETTQPKILHNGLFKYYILTETANEIRLETMAAGSIVFNKNSCSYNLYDPGYIEGQNTKINNISWTVKGKSNSTSTWSNVNSVNNAACIVSVESTNDHVRIIGQKTNTVGTFQIILDYIPSIGIKETMRAYNNNPAWTNHNIGFTETFEVPRVIRFGSQTFDLADYNGTTLGRAWIENNNAKLLKLSDKMFYDFGIGYDNLDNIKISWDGSKAKLSMNYLYGNQIIPYQSWFEVDPTFGPSNAIKMKTVETNVSAGATCAAVNTNNTDNIAQLPDTATNTRCKVTGIEFNLATIPSGILITNTSLKTIVNAPVSTNRNCDIVLMTQRLTTGTATQVYNSITGSTTEFLNATSFCTSAGSRDLDLGSTADSSIGSIINSGQDWVSIGIRVDGNYSNRPTSGGLSSYSFNTWSLTLVYTAAPPNAVTDLTAEIATPTSVDLTWTQPSLFGHTLLGYQLNWTTPCSDDPNIVLDNNTGTGTTYTVSGLTTGICYSFRIGTQSSTGFNASGNIANITANFIPANFTIGSLDPDVTNPDVTPIRYERTDINATHTTLTVIYDADYDMTCDFRFQNEQSSASYYPLTPEVYDSSHNSTDFTLINPEDDITRVTCRDITTNSSANYVIMQSDFPLLEQIANFRNGTYGTQGQFGAFDLITIAVLFVSMIGFNRVNEAVGAIINMSIIGALAYFEIITLPTVIFGAIAVVIMIMVAHTRKD